MEKFNKFLKEYIINNIHSTDYSDIIIDNVSNEETFIVVKYTPVFSGMKDSSENITISCMELLIFVIENKRDLLK